MKALIIGATGATGNDLVDTLLKDPDYTTVVVFVRRSTGKVHAKLVEILTDFDHLDAVSEHIAGDVLFSCLGTTLKQAGSKEKQWQIDYELPLRFARIAKQNKVGSVVLLSAYGASPNSKVFYSQMKGKLEEAYLALAFNRCIFFKPGMLVRKNTDRLGEQLITPVLKGLNKLGLFRRFKPLSTTLLAEKLAKAAKQLPSGNHVIELDRIFGF